MNLFRYRSANANTLAEISEAKAWFSRYDQLNDPFEGAYENLSGERCFDDLVQQLRVCCFSKSRDSLLLWAHYAQNHRGLCLEYELPEDVFRTQFFPVKYSSKQPILGKVSRYPASSRIAGTLSVHIDREAAVFLTKSGNWSYEKEYRALRITKELKSKGEKHKLPGKLSAIYFGLRAEPDTIMLVDTILHAQPDVSLWQAALVPGRYEIQFLPLSGVELSSDR